MTARRKRTFGNRMIRLFDKTENYTKAWVTSIKRSKKKKKTKKTQVCFQGFEPPNKFKNTD